MPRWLLLAHQLPTRPSNARVKTWRRLQQIGAVPTRNSVYVLPNTEQCREDFEWLRSEIVALGGEATVFAADAVNADGAEDIVSVFQRSREADYRGLAHQANGVRRASRAKRARVPSADDALARTVRALRQRLDEIEQIDFFKADGRQDAGEAIAALERLVAGDDNQATLGAHDALAIADFQDRRWVTRPRPGVDRMASAWLIRRFVDPNAVFEFVDRPTSSDLPFDMYSGEFSHNGSLCTFETIAQRFGLVSPTVIRIGQIVHDLDMKETRYALPEVPAIGRMVEGLRQLYADDQALLQQGITMFEALARAFDCAERTQPSPHPRRPPRHVKKRRRSA